MVVFEAKCVCTPSFNRSPLMYPKGYRIYLEPDRYPRHAELADKLRRLGSWTIINPVSNEVAKTEVEKSVNDELLPHQRQVLERLRLMK